MRRPLIAANWKMNTTIDEAGALVEEMKRPLDMIEGIDKVLCPPFISLATVKALLQGTSVKLGAQNMHFEEKGAYTGEISPLMLTGLCDYVILGHSERRHYFGESDKWVNRKIHAAYRARLVPILCIGETLEEREGNRTEQIVTGQLSAALASVDSPGGLVIAYEPVWAIGTGEAATGEQANMTVALIRNALAQLYAADLALETSILYGGSVTADNVHDFVTQPSIDGALVGGASLRAGEFVTIVRESAEISK